MKINQQKRPVIYPKPSKVSFGKLKIDGYSLQKLETALTEDLKPFIHQDRLAQSAANMAKRINDRLSPVIEAFKNKKEILTLDIGKPTGELFHWISAGVIRERGMGAERLETPLAHDMNPIFNAESRFLESVEKYLSEYA